MRYYQEGVDRWRARARPMRRHPTRRAWLAIALCLAILAAAGALIFWFAVFPAVTPGY